MPDFKTEIHQIWFPLGLCPWPCRGSLQRPPRFPSCRLFKRPTFKDRERRIRERKRRTQVDFRGLKQEGKWIGNKKRENRVACPTCSILFLPLLLQLYCVLTVWRSANSVEQWWAQWHQYRLRSAYRRRRHSRHLANTTDTTRTWRHAPDYTMSQKSVPLFKK